MKNFKDKIKRILCFLSAVAIAVFSFPSVSFAKENTDYYMLFDKSNLFATGEPQVQHFSNFGAVDLKSYFNNNPSYYDNYKKYVDTIGTYFKYFVIVTQYNTMDTIGQAQYVYASNQPFYLVYNYQSYGNYYDIVFDYSMENQLYCYDSIWLNDYSLPTPSTKSMSLNGSKTKQHYLSRFSLLYASPDVGVYDTCGDYEEGSYCVFRTSDDDSCGNPFYYDFDWSNRDFFDYFQTLIDEGTLYNINRQSGSYDSSIVSTDFQWTMCGVGDENYLTNYGLAANYQFSQSAWTKLSDGKPKIDVSYRMRMRVREVNSNKVYPLITVRSGYRSYYPDGQSGGFTVDLKDLFSSARIMTDGLDADVNELYTAINGCLSGASVTGWSWTSKSFSSSENTSGSVGVSGSKGCYLNGQFGYSYSETDAVTSSKVTYTYEFEYFTVEAVAVASNGSYKTAERSSTVDLVKGENTSYSNVGSTEDTQTTDFSSYVTNANYYTYNSDDDNYSYYNSTSGETKTVSSPSQITFGDIVVNVDSSGSGGSSGGSGSVTQNNNNTVNIPDNINLNLNVSGSGGSDNVTIDDDDLTDDGLRDDLKDGFGLLDDTNTAEKNDGFIAMISDFYSGIDAKFKTIIMFGVSTSVGIAVLRMIFKR